MQRRNAVGDAGVVEAVLSEPGPVPVERQLDRVGAGTRLAWKVVELQQGLESECDVQRELARLQYVVQLQAPPHDALGGGPKLVLEEREVEAHPVERAQPIRSVEEGHELIRAVQHGDELLCVLVQSGEVKDPLNTRVRVVHGRAGD